MSTDQQIALALRKERVLVRVGQQREQIAQYGEWFKKPCAMADKALSAGQYVWAHPWAAGAAAGVAMLIGRRNLFRWAGYVWSGWRTWRFVSAWVYEAGLIKHPKNK